MKQYFTLKYCGVEVENDMRRKHSSTVEVSQIALYHRPNSTDKHWHTNWLLYKAQGIHLHVSFQKITKAQSAQYQHTAWLISACGGAAALTYGLYSPQQGSGGNESFEKRGWSFNLSPAGPGETYRAAQDWVPARWSDRRQELTRSSAGWGTGWRGGRVEESGGWGSTGKQCKPLFSTYHPPGSQRRRHASATSSPPVTSHIKAGDFSSAPARMLFLPRLWVGLLARRVSGCTVMIPQVFGWREGPSHLRQNGGGQEECGHSCGCVSQDVILSVFHVELRLYELFLLVYIQEIILSGSTTIYTVFLGLYLVTMLPLQLSKQVWN